jgi:hypothetical protein
MKRDAIKIGEITAPAKQGKGTQQIARHYTPEIYPNSYTTEELRAMRAKNGVGRPPKNKVIATPPKLEEGDELKISGKGKDQEYIKKDKKGGVEIGVPVAQMSIKQKR